MIQVTRRNRESINSFLRRFKERVKQTRILKQARDARFLSIKKTKRAKKQSALYRLKAKDKYDRMRKMGQIDEETSYNKTIKQK